MTGSVPLKEEVNSGGRKLVASNPLLDFPEASKVRRAFDEGLSSSDLPALSCSSKWTVGCSEFEQQDLCSGDVVRGVLVEHREQGMTVVKFSCLLVSS